MVLYPSAPTAFLVLAAGLTACSLTPQIEPNTTVVNQASHLTSDSLRSNSHKPNIQKLDSHESDGKPAFRPPLVISDGFFEPPSDALPEGAEVSFAIIDLERGTPIAQYQADRDHIPASSAKLATAVTALKILGPEHQFVTELRRTGSVEDGILKGDLILKGGGDPVLDIPDLLPLIEGLVQQQVRGIEGRFLIDDSLLPRLTEIEPTQPTEAAYNPGLGALSIAYNRVKLQWKKRGDLSIETLPHLDEATFEVADPDRLPPSGVKLKQFDGHHAIWQVADRGGRQSRRSLPVKDPGLHVGLVFADLARLHGLELPAPERAKFSQKSSLIAAHHSRPLREVVRDMLWYSNNLVAELIGLSAARTLEPELASLDMSAGILLSELKRRMPAVSFDNASLHNHSGLSSKSRMTPQQLAAILSYGWQEGMLSSLLPGSGWSRTLSKRFDGPDQAFRIWAKTGTMNYASALGGYLFSPSHSPAVFVIMISDDKARAAYDAQKRRGRGGEKKARVWKNQTERFMNQLIERWLEPAIETTPEALLAMSLANPKAKKQQEPLH